VAKKEPPFRFCGESDPGRPTRNLVTVLTELPRFPLSPVTRPNWSCTSVKVAK